MRYVYIMLGTTALCSVIPAFFIFQSPKPTAPPVIKINNREISAGEYHRIYAARPNRIDNSQNFLDSVITRELLIQEAQRLKIDREESFRISLKKFYEQTLTKILLERQMAALAIEPTPAQLADYQRNQERQVEFRLFSVSSDGKVMPGAGQLYQKPFRDLSTTYQLALLPLKVGETTPPFNLDGKLAAIRLENFTEPAPTGALADTEQLRQTLTEAIQRKALDDWLQGLRQKARITVTDSVTSESEVVGQELGADSLSK